MSGKPNSSKTRIETNTVELTEYDRTKWETKFQQNKDWNMHSRHRINFGALWETKFQQNKDWNLVRNTILHHFQFCGKPNSSKTRIETLNSPKIKYMIFCGKPNSSKTRIETATILKWPIKLLICGKPNSSKTRIETVATEIDSMKINLWETKFQQNKDWNLH